MGLVHHVGAARGQARIAWEHGDPSLGRLVRPEQTLEIDLVERGVAGVEVLAEPLSELIHLVLVDAGLLVSGQTYTRKQDALVLSALSGLAASASKFAHDLRLLQHLKEVEEPFGAKQVGSSAMPYKRNPMKCERMNALARWIVSRRAEFNGAN